MAAIRAIGGMLVFLASSFAVRALAVQDAPQVVCKACADHGVIPCRACAKTGCKAERPSSFCSEAIACKQCGGARFEDCAKCERSPDVDVAKLRADAAAWRETLRPVDAFMGRELRHCQSPHFVLTFDLARIAIEAPKTGDPHTAMHVYERRLEELFDQFCADVGCTEKDFLARTHVFLWNREADQAKASEKYTLQPSTTESKLMGAKPVVTIYYDKSHLHEEYELHQAVVHQVVHCLLSNVYDGIWPGNIKGGWIDEGLAHFYENKLFGEVRHYCYVENDSIQYFKFGRWESSVLAAAQKGEGPGFLGVTGINTVVMTPEQRMFAWSYCDFILRTWPGKFGLLAKAIKAKKTLNEALAASVEKSPFELETAWRAWVLATYSPKPK
jgi:hypothetical protein